MSVLINAVKAQDKAGSLFGKTHVSITDAKFSVMETFSAMIADPQLEYEGGSTNVDVLQAVYGILEIKGALSQYEQKFMNLMSVK